MTLALDECAPYPIAAKLGNVTVQNNQLARGIALSVGTPEQNFAFLPQWPLNNTFVYGTNGHCTLTPPEWTDAGCTTFRGGKYDMLASTTRKAPDAKTYTADNSPFPKMDFVSDTLKLNDNASLTNFPFGIALNDWGEQGYHPMVALGMGPESTVLTRLKDEGLIASKSWGMFYGRNGGQNSSQLDGNFVFGGYDRAKVTGLGHTQQLAPSGLCPSQMLVTILDITLNFANGSDLSLFSNIRSNAISACLVPDYPVLMTMPLDPYFEKFESLTDTSVTDRSLGLSYYSMRYDEDSRPYDGDITFTLQSGLSVRVPNDQLIVPDRTIDQSTGETLANETSPNLVINVIQAGNGDDISQLGRQFLSAAYVMLNQDAGEFTLWAANPTTNEDLVAVNEKGETVTSFCTAGSGTNNTVTAPGDNTDEAPVSHGLSTGATAGIAVACTVVSCAIGAWLVYWCLKRRRRAAAAAQEAVTQSQYNQQQQDAMVQGYYKPELRGSPRCELETHVGLYTEHPSAPASRFELVG